MNNQPDFNSIISMLYSKIDRLLACDKPNRDNKKRIMQDFTRIEPLGPRVGPGSFEFVFDNEKHTMEQAIDILDGVVIDFVKGDEDGLIYFQAYDTKNPEYKEELRLQIQYFPFGIDMIDDELGFRLGIKLLEKRNSENAVQECDATMLAR